MKEDNSAPKRNDILGQRIAEINRRRMPSGFEERIMLNVRREARRLRRKNIWLSILAGVVGVELLLAVIHAAFHFTGVNLGLIFTFDVNLFGGLTEGLEGINPTIWQITVSAILICILYLSINGIINNRERQKALREEYGEYF